MNKIIDIQFDKLHGDLEDTYLIEFPDQQMYMPKSVVSMIDKKNRIMKVQHWFVKLHHLMVYAHE